VVPDCLLHDDGARRDYPGAVRGRRGDTGARAVEGEEGEMSREAKAFAMALGSMMKNDMDYFDKYPIDVSPLTRDEIDILKMLGEWTEEGAMILVYERWKERKMR
jgi:hypothetical protein